MNEPKEAAWELVKASIKDIADRCPKEFEAFMGWIEKERNERDRENRTKGQENKTSEAEALTTILNTVKKASEHARA